MRQQKCTQQWEAAMKDYTAAISVFGAFYVLPLKVTAHVQRVLPKATQPVRDRIKIQTHII